MAYSEGPGNRISRFTRAAVRVVEGKRSQGSGAFKDYDAPNGTKLRVLNPDIRQEANRRASAAIRGVPGRDKK